MTTRARGGGALAAAILLLSALAPVASADNGVRVQVNGGTPRVFTQDQVEGERDIDAFYTVRHLDGSTEREQLGGAGVGTLLERLAHIPPQFVRTVDVERDPGQSDVELSGDEVRGGFHNDPEGDPRYALIDAGNNSHVAFFRPVRDGGDQNARDRYETRTTTTGAAEDLVLKVTTTNDTVRQVDASVSDKQPKPGVGVDFAAHVTNPGGRSFTYSWDFGDGATADGQASRHAFAAGHWQVKVQAFGDDGSSGIATIDIQAGDPSPARTPTPTPSGGQPSGGSGGGGPGAGGGARSGGGEGNKKQTSSGPRRSRTRGQRNKPAATSTPAPDSQAAPGTGDGIGGGSPGGASGAVSGSSSPKPGSSSGAPSPKAQPGTQTAPPQGESVDGIVLASAGSVADVIASARADQQRSAARRGGGGGGSVLGWVAGGGFFVLLLGVGAVREGGFRWRARSG